MSQLQFSIKDARTVPQGEQKAKIEVKGLNFYYGGGKPALKDVNLKLGAYKEAASNVLEVPNAVPAPRRAQGCLDPWPGTPLDAPTRIELATFGAARLKVGRM